ncbi:hypothetical protein BJX62DRAFT_211447 [Aspergillus germanicus]
MVWVTDCLTFTVTSPGTQSQFFGCAGILRDVGLNQNLSMFLCCCVDPMYIFRLVSQGLPGPSCSACYPHRTLSTMRTGIGPDRP